MGSRFFTLTLASLGFGVFLFQCAPLTPLMNGSGDGTVPVRFVYLDAAAASVCIAGSFNGWSAQTDCMRRAGGLWTVDLRISPGRHQYAFVIDGNTWRPDPEAVLSEDSGFGRLNSVLIVE